MGKLTDKEIHDRIKKGRNHLREWRVKAREDYAFVASDQWSDDDKAVLEEKGRPQIVFNRVARTVNTVSGLEIQNRQEVRYIPREQQDAGVNDVLTAAAKWIRDMTDAEDEESESFQDLVICGLGWTEMRMEYEVDPDGTVEIDRLDPLEMGYDPSSKKRNLSDTKYRFREKKITVDEFKELFPGEDITLSENDDFFENDDHDATEAYKYENDQSNEEIKQQMVTIVHFQYWTREAFVRVMDPQSGKLVEFSVSRFNKLKKNIPELRGVKQQRRVFYTAWMVGKKSMNHDKSPTQEGFTFSCMTGMRNRNKNTWFGLVELMKDPQRWANKWLSQILFILNSNAKGGAFVEEGAFSNPRKAEENWASPDALIMLTAGSIKNGKIQERTMAPYPAGLDKLMTYAMESINDIPGVSLELMGLTARNQPGVIESQRKQSGITILAVFFDSLRRYRKEQGRILADFIRSYISDGRLVRIVGEEGAQVVPLIKDEMTFKFDVVIDDAPTSPNQKERVFAIMSELVPIFQAAGQPLPPEVLDYLPLPETVIQKIKQRMAQQQQPDPIQQQATQLELVGKDLDNKETQSKTVLNFAKAQKEGAVSQDELAQADLKREQMGSDLQLKREQMVEDLQIKREKNVLDALVKEDANKRKGSNG